MPSRKRSYVTKSKTKGYRSPRKSSKRVVRRSKSPKRIVYRSKSRTPIPKGFRMRFNRSRVVQERPSMIVMPIAVPGDRRRRSVGIWDFQQSEIYALQDDEDYETIFNTNWILLGRPEADRKLEAERRRIEKIQRMETEIKNEGRRGPA